MEGVGGDGDPQRGWKEIKTPMGGVGTPVEGVGEDRDPQREVGGVGPPPAAPQTHLVLLNEELH